MKKIILITGASSGFGLYTAKALIKKGYTVYGAARRLEKMQELVDLGGFALKMDVTDDESVKVGVQQIIDEQGQIDVLVNNAVMQFTVLLKPQISNKQKRCLM